MKLNKGNVRFDAIPWLLEIENPSVRYFALVGLFDKREDDPEVVGAKRKIMEAGVVPKIMKRQKRGGYWERAEDFYVRAKYRGTVWQLILLAELNADKRDARVRDACEFVLRVSQDRDSGGFAYRGSRGGGGLPGAVIPCLTGNMVWSLLRFGWHEDPRVQQGIDWIVRYQRFDDGAATMPRGWPYDGREPCWGRHTCHLGVVKALKALSAIPEAERSAAVRDMIEEGAEHLLRHRLFKRSHDLTKVAKPKWMKLGFPLMWDTDALDILLLLLDLGYRDDRMEESVDLLLSKQDDKGRWILERTFNGRFQVDIEYKNRPSKWITLNALRALRMIAK